MTLPKTSTVTKLSALPPRAHVDRKWVEKPQRGTRVSQLARRSTQEEDAADLHADKQISCSEESLAEQSMQPEVGREREGEEGRVAVGRPAIWRLASQHELRAIGEHSVVDIRVPYLEVVV
eukprot:CAMPEP_0205856176 /NCGR_PEP_ID=MMETSP1083-20121108/2988_1 /ASSEMBLY_ACC=CAM_ASM_000430 /TAXON_ID=97485 /ORGANISM="Prymnesium parvum, Strain Texoma1" /LENGTH=120 /DNA_ID=CAMNT_0053217579 /DNA_START=581 /DNA_END=938 /DNA_ORIENTATION=-